MTYYLLTIATLALVFALLGPQVLTLVFPQNYRGAAPFIAWVVLGYLAYGIYYVPISYLAITTGETRPIPLATIAAALTNVALNLWLIPQYGAISAAINTAVSYTILAAMMTFITARITHLPVEFGRVGKILAGTAVLFITGRYLMRFSPVYNVLLGLVIVAFLPLVLHIFRFWKDEELERLAQIIRRYHSTLTGKSME